MQFRCMFCKEPIEFHQQLRFVYDYLNEREMCCEKCYKIEYEGYKSPAISLDK